MLNLIGNFFFIVIIVKFVLYFICGKKKNVFVKNILEREKIKGCISRYCVNNTKNPMTNWKFILKITSNISNLKHTNKAKE